MITKHSTHVRDSHSLRKAGTRLPASQENNENDTTARKMQERKAPPIPPGFIAFLFAVLMGVFSWAYWPTLSGMTQAWYNEPDYSHGFLVPLISVFFLWTRRESFPGFTPSISLQAMAFLTAGLALRFTSGYYYIRDLDGWSIILWACGVALVLGGKRLFHWALPAIGFLMFMVPLPYRAERLLSLPLQRVATDLSSWILQLLGQPALAEGNVILVGDEKLFVEEACSGIRIFVGIIALAYALVFFKRCPTWERIVLLACVPIVAIAANTGRIVLTALAVHWLPESAGATSRTLAHDVIGLISIPLAAVMFFWIVGLMRSLFPEEETVDASRLIRRRAAATTA